jgi:hypothetical protein
MLLPEQSVPCNNRTSAAKAAHAEEVYGTAEAVPFVQRLGCRKPNLDKPEVHFETNAVCPRWNER